MFERVEEVLHHAELAKCYVELVGSWQSIIVKWN